VPASYRRASVADAEALSHAAVAAIQSYRSFTPAGWEPPPAELEIEHAQHLLPDPAVWCLLAEEDGAVVGQITILSAARSAAHPVDEPGLGHLRNLFVDPGHWGAGIAKALADAAVKEARARGFTALRLYVAAGQARARRFYEREGWAPAGPEFDEPALGYAVLEYRRPLQRARPSEPGRLRSRRRA
jgi:ribosomal protein S18 acetylase RimI-like enzyme